MGCDGCRWKLFKLGKGAGDRVSEDPRPDETPFDSGSNSSSLGEEGRKGSKWVCSLKPVRQEKVGSVGGVDLTVDMMGCASGLSPMLKRIELPGFLRCVPSTPDAGNAHSILDTVFPPVRPPIGNMRQINGRKR
jgi:hypothetical protein